MTVKKQYTYLLLKNNIHICSIENKYTFFQKNRPKPLIEKYIYIYILIETQKSLISLNTYCKKLFTNCSIMNRQKYYPKKIYKKIIIIQKN